MSAKFRLTLLLIFFGCCLTASAQVKETEKDTAKMYRKIEEFSKKRKFTKFLHGLIFEPVKVAKKVETRNKRKARKRTLDAFEGKIVRHLNIETFDPFGYSDVDETDKPTQYIAKVGNSLHLKTKRLTILNLLLIKRNRRLDSLQLRESERLIRSQRFVRAVTITPVKVAGTDSVDVNIRVIDAWSLVPDFSASSSRTTFGLTERNFFGLGHTVENTYQKEFSTGNDAYSIKYIVPNIMNTYIRTTLGYQFNLDQDYLKSINIERPFYSPLARWAGGIYFDQRFKSDTLPDASMVYSRQFFKSNTQDFWAGHSFSIIKGQTERARTTNLITTLRYYQVRFTESPAPAYDTINYFANEKFYLAGIGVSSRQYREDKYIFNYGIVEDVPIGRVFAVTAGWQEKNSIKRPYFGARLSLGKYYTWGYLSSNFEYGTFLSNRARNTEESAFTVQGNYFTPLMESGKWKFRQFAKARMVVGMNRNPIFADQLSLTDDSNGIPGFNSSWLYGTKKFVFTLQTQGYSPWNLAGFRLNPFIASSFGILSNPGEFFFQNKVYPKFTAGFIISNDFLVFSSFQLSFSYFPSIPNVGEDVYKSNAFSTEDFGFQNFDLNKPRTVDYE